MNLEDLRAAQTRERATDGLQELRESFYEEVADYLRDLEDERDEAAAEADDPFRSEEVQQLTDEIETAEQVAEAIYERRMGKIVKQASLAAAGMRANADGLTTEETALYDDLVARIEENKRHVLDVIAGEATTDRDAAATSESPERSLDLERESASRTAEPEPASTDDGETVAPSAPTDPEPAASSAAAAMGDEDRADPTPPPEEPPRDAGDVDEPEAAADEPALSRKTVRVTQDVGEIFGLDERTYTLEADDVVTLPKENADPLLERDAAEELTPEQ
ncbi:hypothetical protein [Halocalculus aciditolerans]|uniref:DNA replication factor GINS n=1 Tax=Halocalculus aciditolerans TaxID=1383812 RepID=A0A830F1J6_9EURY|nr:hypothetical protein [Halocalculus aciditolerans]GGL53480.1 hypothetical protein GCM10009039_09590 [Halocalculus aciditolerans]